MKISLFKYAVLLLALVTSFNVLAQDVDDEMETKGKPNVFIDYFSRPSNISSSWAEALRNNVIEGLQSTNRIEIIDVDASDILRMEQNRRQQDNISDGEDMERLAVMVQEGANYLLQGHLNSIASKRNVPKSGDPYYTVTMEYTIKVINPRNGKLVTTKTYSYGGGLIDFNTGSTEAEAAQKVIATAKKDMKGFVEIAFPLMGRILEIDEQKKGEAKTAYISLGSDHGVKKDVVLEAFTTREIQGRISRKVIGEVKVKTVEGDDLSLVEVKKGGKEILDAINAGQTVRVASKQK